jgi:hypothetical protein
MFRPTALLVQTHNVTGLKYFCKTTDLAKVHWYKGSGTVWKRHLKKHGNDVSTGIMGFYLDRQRCVEAALEFSRTHNIVASKEWANLVEENAETGAQGGDKHPMFGRPHPQKGTTTSKLKGRYIGALNPMYGKPSPMRGKHNVDASLAHKGRKRPEGGGKKPHAVIGTKDGITVEFNSVSDAARFINGSRSSVHMCCNGKAKTGGGYTWKYKEQLCRME